MTPDGTCHRLSPAPTHIGVYWGDQRAAVYQIVGMYRRDHVPSQRSPETATPAGPAVSRKRPGRGRAPGAAHHIDGVKQAPLAALKTRQVTIDPVAYLCGNALWYYWHVPMAIPSGYRWRYMR